MRIRGVAAVLAAGMLALVACTSSGGGKSPGGSVSATPSASGSTSSSGSPGAGSSSRAGSSSPAAAATGRVAPKLTHFRIADVTYVGSQAWALGTAKCLSGAGNGCSAIEHSTDGGHSWQSLPTPVTTVVVGPGSAARCATSCVQHIRFATTRVGYVFGATVAGQGHDFFTTGDGGLTWHAQPEGAQALESLGGNVIRVVTTTTGCPPGCTYRVQTAAIGSAAWHAVALPAAATGGSIQLARSGRHAYLELTQNPAGGSNNEKSTLFTSSDDGARWSRHGEPCPQAGGREVDSSMLSSAPGGSVTVLCTPRGGGQPFIATSTSGGASFQAGLRTALGSAGISALAAASSKVSLVSSDNLYRSTDGGRHFARVGGSGGGSPGQLAWLGFASSSLGHGVSTDRRSIWTTRNAGASWTAHTFS